MNYKTHIYRFFFLIVFCSSVIPLSGSDKPVVSSNPMEYTQIDTFFYGAFNSVWDWHNFYAPSYLNFNLWHKYIGENKTPSGRHYPNGWVTGDSLFYGINSYKKGVTEILDSIYSNNLKALLMRPKIVWLSYGQRSDYQCENVPKNDDLWFYAFNTHKTGSDFYDNSQFGDRQMVRYCSKSGNSPGIVVSGLRANTEQSKTWGTYQGDDECDWYIKPRIRIPASFPFTNPEDTVCRLTVLGQDGSSVLKNVFIKAKHFINNHGKYDGSYIEEFFQGEGNIKIKGAWGYNMFYQARGLSLEKGDNNADIQLFWYGKCDMWIDYIRVDNDIADRLFKGEFEKEGNNWFEWEAGEIAGHNNGDAVHSFYMELFEFNNIPAMKYVSHKLDSIFNARFNKHISITAIFVPIIFSQHVPWSMRNSLLSPDFIDKHLFDNIGMTNILVAYYPFTNKYQFPEPEGDYDVSGGWSFIPNTLPRYSGSGTLAKPVTPARYDDWLQSYLDSTPYSLNEGFNSTTVRHPSIWQDPGGLKYHLKMGDDLSKVTGLPLIFNPQAHLWFKKGEMQREPTNQELDLQVNLAVAFGAKGIVWFQYPSGEHTVGQDFYDFGIGNMDTEVKFKIVPRNVNMYGQNKWEKMGEIGTRLKSWGPHLTSFGDKTRKTFTYRIAAERFSMSSSTFINSLIAYTPIGYPPDSPSTVDINTLPSDPVGQTYLQVAFFNKIDGDDGDYYFMVVNRRCSPFINSSDKNSNGGRRIIAFEPNVTFLRSAPVWKIVDLATGKTVVKFSLGNDTNVILGDFMPGEGKLYKLTSTPD